MQFLGFYNYWIFILLLSIGLYTIIVKRNYVKRMIGLAIFQAAVFLLFITMDKVEGGTAPIFSEVIEGQLYANPLPQVLILTAIVVGIAVTSLGLALVVRIKEEFGSIEEDEIRQLDRDS